MGPFGDFLDFFLKRFCQAKMHDNTSMEPGYLNDANDGGRSAMNAVCLVTAESKSPRNH